MLRNDVLKSLMIATAIYGVSILTPYDSEHVASTVPDALEAGLLDNLPAGDLPYFEDSRRVIEANSEAPTKTYFRIFDRARMVTANEGDPLPLRLPTEAFLETMMLRKETPNDLDPLLKDHDSSEVGSMLLRPEATGKGIATHLKVVLADIAFNEGSKLVWATAAGPNTHAQRSLAKAGRGKLSPQAPLIRWHEDV